MPEAVEGLEHTDITPVKQGTAEVQSQTESNPLDIHYAAKIAFTSIRLAQGNPILPESRPDEDSLQTGIFKYIHAAHPSWKIDNSNQVTELTTKRVVDMFHPRGPDGKSHLPGRMLKAGTDRIKSMLNLEGTKWHGKYYPRRTDSDIHARIPTERIFDQTKMDVEKLQSILESQNELAETQEELTPILVDKFVSTDAIYLLQQNGRKKANPDSEKIINDPYGSFTIHYILRGRPTGVAEFDEMCSTLKTYILQQTAQPTSEWTTKTGPLLDSIIKKYNEHHSAEKQYTLPSLEEIGAEERNVTAESTEEVV